MGFSEFRLDQRLGLKELLSAGIGLDGEVGSALMI